MPPSAASLPPLALSLSLLMAVLACACMSATAPYVPAAPTTAHPRFLWTDAMRARLDAMRTAPAASPAGRMWAWMFAQNAWDLINTQFIKVADKKDGDFYRRWVIRGAIVYDHIYNWMDGSKRSALAKRLDSAVTWMTQEDPENPGTRLFFRDADTDEIVGWYFGIVLAHAAMGDTSDVPAKALLGRTWLGGMHATAADFTTVRNELLALTTTVARGGAWPESSYYDGGTMHQLLLVHQCARTAFGVDHFPEVAAFADVVGVFWMHMTTPDLVDTYLWGDENEGDRCHVWGYRGAYTVGLTLIASQVAPSQAVRDQTWRFYSEQFGSKFTGEYGDPWLPDEALFFWKAPDAAQGTDWRTAQPRGLYSDSTAGVGLYRTGWGAGDTLLGFDFPKALWLDHMTCYNGNVQVYRKGEWVLTNPQSYGAPTTTGTGGANTMRLAGFPQLSAPEAHQAREAKGVVAVEFAETWALVQGVHSGHWRQSGDWYVPDVVQHEHTRSILYLPSADSSHDTVVLLDRLHVLDPRESATWTAPYTWGDAKMKSEILAELSPRKKWYLHTPVAPALSSTCGTATWTTPKGQRAQVRTLTPCRYGAVVDEKADASWADYDVAASQRMFHVTVSPDADRDWDAMLHVFQAADTQATLGALTSSLVTGAGGRVVGALLHIAGAADTLALFNGRQSPRLRQMVPKGNGQFFLDPSNVAAARAAHLMNMSRGEALSVDVAGVATASLRVFVADLDGAQYSVRANAGAAVTVRGSAKSGMLTTTLASAGPGAVTLTITKTSDAPPMQDSGSGSATVPSYPSGGGTADISDGADVKSQFEQSVGWHGER
eukprot:m51a1_g6874 hypothetical protein (830) ;mRNA; r:187258-190609